MSAWIHIDIYMNSYRYPYAQIIKSDAIFTKSSSMMLIQLHKYTYEWRPNHTQNLIYPQNPKGDSNKKNFIFFKLKIETRIHFFFLQKNARAKKAQIHFLESMKVQKIQIQSFCKLKILRHVQIQSVKTAKCFRKRQSHFLQTQTVHKSSFQ